MLNVFRPKNSYTDKKDVIVWVVLDAARPLKPKDAIATVVPDASRLSKTSLNS